MRNYLTGKFKSNVYRLHYKNPSSARLISIFPCSKNEVAISARASRKTFEQSEGQQVIFQLISDQENTRGSTAR